MLMHSSKKFWIMDMKSNFNLTNKPFQESDWMGSLLYGNNQKLIYKPLSSLTFSCFHQQQQCALIFTFFLFSPLSQSMAGNVVYLYRGMCVRLCVSLNSCYVRALWLTVDRSNHPTWLTQWTVQLYESRSYRLLKIGRWNRLTHTS